MNYSIIYYTYYVLSINQKETLFFGRSELNHFSTICLHFRLSNSINRLINCISGWLMAEFMFLPVNLRPGGRRLPSLGIYRSVNCLIDLFLGVSNIDNNLWGSTKRQCSFYPALRSYANSFALDSLQKWISWQLFFRLLVDWWPS